MGRSSWRSIAPIIHREGGVIDVHLMVSNPAHHFPLVREAGGDSVTFHVETSEGAVEPHRPGALHELGVGIAINPETAVKDAVAASPRRRSRPLHEHPSRLLGPSNSCRRRSRESASFERSCTSASSYRSTVASRTTTSAASIRPTRRRSWQDGRVRLRGHNRAYHRLVHELAGDD